MICWISVKKAAPALDMTEDQVYRAIREKKFPFQFVRIGKLIRISSESLGLPVNPDDEIETTDLTPTEATQ